MTEDEFRGAMREKGWEDREIEEMIEDHREAERQGVVLPLGFLQVIEKQTIYKVREK